MIKEILETARGLIAQGFAHGVYARDAAGQRVNATSGEACAFCSIGAVRRAHYTLRPDSIFAGEEFAAEVAGAVILLSEGATGTISDPFWRLAEFNDAHNQDDVLALFDSTIAKLEQA
jgi:hypothetical protein